MCKFAPPIFCILDKEVNLFVIFRTKKRKRWNNNYFISSPSLIHWKFGKQTWKQDFAEFTTHMLTASFHAEQGVWTRNRNRKGRIKGSGRKAWLKITIFAIPSPFLLPSFLGGKRKVKIMTKALILSHTFLLDRIKTILPKWYKVILARKNCKIIFGPL